MDNRASQDAMNVTIRHRGRGSQVRIYFGKLLRMFVYQNDWKVLPMAALIAGLVGMVVRKKMFLNMEGTLMGAFAFVCVCIWNGCFNSIQVICRERDVIKREHRSGMHIFSYVFSHMLYQAILCLLQTFVTLYVTLLVGVKYPSEGLITSFFLLDFAISMFLISFASDMLSLWVSSLSHNTTTAMTIMPFVLIFQLVFSGGMLTLPAWTETLTHFTISNPGLKVIAAQADTNSRPYATISSMLTKMRDNEIGGSFTLGEMMDLLQSEDNSTIASLRSKQIGKTATLGEIKKALDSSSTWEAFRQEHLLEDMTAGEVLKRIAEADELKEIRAFSLTDSGFTLGDLIDEMLTSEELKPALEAQIIHEFSVGDLLDKMNADGIIEKYSDVEIGRVMTLGEIIDFIAGNPDVQEKRGTEFTVKTTVGKLIDTVGEEKVKSFIEEKAAKASYQPAYENSAENIAGYWLSLMGFALLFAVLATVTLEFIDKDKR